MTVGERFHSDLLEHFVGRLQGIWVWRSTQSILGVLDLDLDRFSLVVKNNRRIYEIYGMAIRITGNDVRAVRGALGLNVGQFASVLGVHPSSVHRWEGAREMTVAVDGVAATVLAALRAHLDDQAERSREVRELGAKVIDVLVVAGALAALGVLIHYLTSAGRR